jgi:signal transduction histidine kinase
MSSGLPARRPKVLYVDDQEGNLLVFRATFRKHADVTTCASPAEALRLLEREEFPVVLSDQRMDEMSGAAFLAEVRRRRPDSIRMLVTAFSHLDDAVSAINEGQVSRYVQKPWDAQELLAAIRDADELYWKTRENRILSEKLLHRERLAVIGQVTSGLVHELGNIAAVLTLAHDVKEQLARGEDASEEIAIVQTGVDKLLVLIESLRIYSKGGDQLRLERSEVDVARLADGSLVLLRLFPSVKALRELVVEAREPAPAVVDAKKLQQVLLNLVKNAAEAAPPGAGRVLLEVGTDAEGVVLEVSDNGPGIPTELEERVWGGFYTTKGDKGTGLGLQMCRKIVEAHGGTIELGRHPILGGCRFTVRIPRS